MELKDGDNLYCVGNEIIKEEDLINQEYDYVYYDPIIFKTDKNEWLIINFELTQAEVIIENNGQLTSETLIKDEVVIRTMIKIIKEAIGYELD